MRRHFLTWVGYHKVQNVWDVLGKALRSVQQNKTFLDSGIFWPGSVHLKSVMILNEVCSPNVKLEP